MVVLEVRTEVVKTIICNLFQEWYNQRRCVLVMQHTDYFQAGESDLFIFIFSQLEKAVEDLHVAQK